MSYDWHQFLYAGQDLIGYKPDEPITEETDFRIAAIVLYYSVFRLTRNYLRDYQGFNITYGHGNHSDVIFELERLGKGQFIALARMLKTLKTIRESANYDDKYNGDLSKQIISILDDAERAVRIIDRLTKP